MSATITLSSISHPSLSLHLRPLPFEERVSLLIQEIERASFFTEEERIDLATALTRLESSPETALTAILCQVIEKAIIRLADEGDEELEVLFNWQESLPPLIQEALGEARPAAAFITSFKTAVFAAIRLNQTIAEMHIDSEEEIQKLYDKSNSLSAAIDDGSLETTEEINALGLKRLADIKTTKNQVLSLQAKELAVKARIVGAVSAASKAFKRSDLNERERLTLYEEATDGVKKIS